MNNSADTTQLDEDVVIDYSTRYCSMLENLSSSYILDKVYTDIGIPLESVLGLRYTKSREYDSVMGLIINYYSCNGILDLSKHDYPRRLYDINIAVPLSGTGSLPDSTASEDDSSATESEDGTLFLTIEDAYILDSISCSEAKREEQVRDVIDASGIDMYMCRILPIYSITNACDYEEGNYNSRYKSWYSYRKCFSYCNITRSSICYYSTLMDAIMTKSYDEKDMKKLIRDVIVQIFGAYHTMYKQGLVLCNNDTYSDNILINPSLRRRYYTEEEGMYIPILDDFSSQLLDNKYSSSGTDIDLELDNLVFFNMMYNSSYISSMLEEDDDSSDSRAIDSSRTADSSSATGGNATSNRVATSNSITDGIVTSYISDSSRGIFYLGSMIRLARDIIIGLSSHEGKFDSLIANINQCLRYYIGEAIDIRRQDVEWDVEASSVPPVCILLDMLSCLDGKDYEQIKKSSILSLIYENRDVDTPSAQYIISSLRVFGNYSGYKYITELLGRDYIESMEEL